MNADQRRRALKALAAITKRRTATETADEAVVGALETEAAATPAEDPEAERVRALADLEDAGA